MKKKARNDDSFRAFSFAGVDRFGVQPWGRPPSPDNQAGASIAKPMTLKPAST